MMSFIAASSSLHEHLVNCLQCVKVQKKCHPRKLVYSPSSVNSNTCLFQSCTTFLTYFLWSAVFYTVHQQNLKWRRQRELHRKPDKEDLVAAEALRSKSSAFLTASAAVCFQCALKDKRPWTGLILTFAQLTEKETEPRAGTNHWIDKSKIMQEDRLSQQVFCWL